MAKQSEFIIYPPSNMEMDKTKKDSRFPHSKSTRVIRLVIPHSVKDRFDELYWSYLKNEQAYGKTTRHDFVALVIDLLDDKNLAPAPKDFVRWITRKGKRVSHFNNKETVSVIVQITDEHYDNYLKLIYHFDLGKKEPTVSSFIPQFLEMASEKLGYR